MIRYLVKSLKSNSFKSFVRYKAVSGEVMQILLDDDVEMIELKKKEYAGTEATALFVQRLTRLENALRIVSRFVPTFDVAVPEMGAKVVLNEEYESQPMYDTDKYTGNKFLSPMNQSPKRSLKYNVTVDQDFKSAVGVVTYELEGSFSIVRINAELSIHWRCMGKTQNAKIYAELSLDNVHWLAFSHVNGMCIYDVICSEHACEWVYLQWVWNCTCNLCHVNFIKEDWDSSAIHSIAPCERLVFFFDFWFPRSAKLRQQHGKRAAMGTTKGILLLAK